MSELRIMVTGASSGIGACVAEQLAQRGHRVVGAARRTDAIAALPAVIPMALDLADPASIEQATRLVDDTLGPLDVLINCAGYGEFGSIEETPLDDGRRQMEVNLFGAVDLIQRVLPGMRSAGRGRIVNVSSLAGEFAAPLGGWYHASKFALEAISDSLRGEVSQFGIDVTIVQPGLCRHRLASGCHVAPASCIGERPVRADGPRHDHLPRRRPGSAPDEQCPRRSRHRHQSRAHWQAPHPLPGRPRSHTRRRDGHPPT